MRVALVTNQLSLRGTEIVLAGYARCCVSMGWTVSFLVRHARDNRPVADDCTPESYAYYESQWDIVYSGRNSASEAWLAKNVDIALVEIYGHPDDWLPTSVPSIAHCVFTTAYPLKASLVTAVSKSVARLGGTRVLPNIVEAVRPTGDLRNTLGIPQDAVVFGRHGGKDTFDIPWVHEVVERTARNKPDIWFLFMNTPQFTPKTPNVVFLEATTCPQRKANFVATCDAMLHARTIGETFGLAVSEFAIQNKPVITYYTARDTEHLDLLGDAAIKYRDAAGLALILATFTKASRTKCTGYSKYTPELVLPLFAECVKDAIKAFFLTPNNVNGAAAW